MSTTRTAGLALVGLLVASSSFDVYVWDQCYSMEQTLRIE
jgi:hypothetical protein